MSKHRALSSCWALLLLLCATPVWAGDAIDDKLKAGADALEHNALREADEIFTQVSNANQASRWQRATSFAGRCAVRYKSSLKNNSPGQIPQAISDCDRAIELKSDLQQAYRIRGIALLSAGHPERAAEDLNVAVALLPDDFLSFQNRALALAKLGRSQEAMAELDAAIRLKPDHPWSYYNRGRMHMTRGEYEAAIDDFIAFIRFKRDHEEVYRLRGQSRLLIGLPQQAVGDFYESLRLRPGKNPDAHFLRGVAFYLLDRFVEADQDLTTALQLQTSHIENRLWLYLVRKRLGKSGQEILNDPAITMETKNWPGTLIATFRGELSPEKAIESARQNDDPIEARLRENLTLLLLGQLAQINKQSDKALLWLGAIKKEANRETPYFRIAQQELRQLAQTANETPAPYPTQSFRAAIAQAESDDQAAPTPEGAPSTRTAAQTPESTPSPKEAPNPVQAKTPEPPPAQEELPIRVKGKPPEPPPAQEKAPARLQNKPSDQSTTPATAPARLHGSKTNPSAASTTAPPHQTMTSQALQGKFVFQAASYTNLDYANQAVDEFKKNGLPAFVELNTVREKTYHRILIGPFDNRSLAEAAQKRMRETPKQTPGEIKQR